MFKYLFWEMLSIVVSIGSFVFIVIFLFRNKTFKFFARQRGFYIPIILIILSFFLWLFANKTYPPSFAMPPFMHSHAPGGISAALPIGKVIEFLFKQDDFARIEDIGADPNSVPQEAQKPDADGIVRIDLVAKEVISEIAPNIYFNFWTYNGQVPGPMLRVKEGDTVEISLTNDISSLHRHNIDLHSVSGPGGGAVLSNVAPGETKTFRWKALNPGLYIYHCAMANVSTHNSHGQYGLIMIDPKDKKNALPKVDKEFYITQGEYYTSGQLGKKGLVPFDSEALIDGIPNYVVFNGRIEDVPRMHAKVGETVRIYVGNGGVNLISSFHVIGEIFDTVYPNANIGGALEHNTQTAMVLPGGAAIVEFKFDVPGKYILVDHALARMNKGAWAVIEVAGKENLDVFSPVTDNNSHAE